VLLRSLAQDYPDLVFDRAAVVRRAEPQPVADGVIELSDGEAGHRLSLADMIAMLSYHEGIAITFA
jgi:hypothetical protein